MHQVLPTQMDMEANSLEQKMLPNGLQAREYREILPHLWSMVGSERGPVAETVLWVDAAEVAVCVPGPTSGWANLKATYNSSTGFWEFFLFGVETRSVWSLPCNGRRSAEESGEALQKALAR